MCYIWYDMDGLVFELFELVCHLKIYRLSICSCKFQQFTESEVAVLHKFR
jgi:hypothetical protein